MKWVRKWLPFIVIMLMYLYLGLILSYHSAYPV